MVADPQRETTGQCAIVQGIVEVFEGDALCIRTKAKQRQDTG